MADLPLAMLFGGTLCLYFAVGRRKIAYWLVALPLAVLTLTKDICFAYGLIAAFLIGLDLWLAADEPCRKAFPKALLRAGALAVIVLAAFSSWGRYGGCHPTADTAASVGSEGLSYGAVLVGGVKAAAGHGPHRKVRADHGRHGQRVLYAAHLPFGRRHHGRGCHYDGRRRGMAGRRQGRTAAAACWPRIWGLRSALRRCICSI